MTNKTLNGTLGLTLLLLSGCALPRFELPRDRGGSPSVASIVQRITCELVEMVKGGPNEYDHRISLLAGNYYMAATLTLTVVDSGGLSPSISVIPTSEVTVGAGATLSGSRSREMTLNLLFSMTELNDNWKDDHTFGACPVVDTVLAGDLGIKDTASLAFEAANRNVALKESEFGGSTSFTYTRSLNAVGPTWTLTRFKGPGGLGSLGRVKTDKLTFAFADGGAGKGKAATRPSEKAKFFLNQILTGEINSKLDAINNRLQ